MSREKMDIWGICLNCEFWIPGQAGNDEGGYLALVISVARTSRIAEIFI